LIGPAARPCPWWRERRGGNSYMQYWSGVYDTKVAGGKCDRCSLHI